MDKVKLPREVAEAIRNLREREHHDPSHILWRSSRPEAEDVGSDWRTIHDFVNIKGNNFILADALRYGYEIEAKPITVTATAEQQEGLKNYYELLDPADQVDKNDAEYIRGERAGIRYALAFLGIKIPGIPEEDLTDVKVFEEANDR